MVQRYGTQQAGATAGYNPTRKGRPIHHPLLAFLDTGDCLGVRWRPGAAHTAACALEWIPTLVNRLRHAGVAQITVRLDKGFFSEAMVALLRRLRVDFALKVPDHAFVRRALGPWRASEKADGYWTATGTLFAAALRSVEQRETVAPAAEALLLPTQTRVHVAHVLTNRDDWHASRRGGPTTRARSSSSASRSSTSSALGPRPSMISAATRSSRPSPRSRIRCCT